MTPRFVLSKKRKIRMLLAEGIRLRRIVSEIYTPCTVCSTASDILKEFRKTHKINLWDSELDDCDVCSKIPTLNERCRIFTDSLRPDVTHKIKELTDAINEELQVLLDDEWFFLDTTSITGLEERLAVYS